MPAFKVELYTKDNETAAIRNLRQALKVLLRRFDLKATSIEEVST